jgi:hypothetical protein
VKEPRKSAQIERMNGEIRNREKIMHGLKKEQTTVLKGYQIYHNYVRPHESSVEKHIQKYAVSRWKAKTNG